MRELVKIVVRHVWYNVAVEDETMLFVRVTEGSACGKRYSKSYTEDWKRIIRMKIGVEFPPQMLRHIFVESEWGGQGGTVTTRDWGN